MRFIELNVVSWIIREEFLDKGGTGHLLIIGVIQVHYHQHTCTLTALEFSKLTIFDQNHFFKCFEKVKIIKASAGFNLTVYI